MNSARYPIVHSFAGIQNATPHPPKSKEKKSARAHPNVPQIPIKGTGINENVSPNVANSARGVPKNPRFVRRLNSQRSLPSPVIKDGPITPQEAITNYAPLLTSHEINEIRNYHEIYFLGHRSKKVEPSQLPKHNHGFDTSDHHLKANVGDHLAYRYEIKAALGKGAFGQVLRCFDHKQQKTVALKIIINTEQMHEQGRIEVGILRELNITPTDTIISGFDSFMFRNHICVTFEMLGLNLYDYHKSIGFRPLSESQIKSISHDILSALAFCHSKRVVHADLKPENVLLCNGSTTRCKLIDFGSSCFIGHAKYEYIQSRFYRAPEVILGIKYGPPMDIWSFGCVVIELLIGKPIFPAQDENELIEMISEIRGQPPRNVIISGPRRHIFFDERGRPIHKNLRSRRRIPGSSSLRVATRIQNPLLIDLLEKCLEWDQTKRITAEQALKHPWFTSKRISTPRSTRKSGLDLPSLQHFR